MPALTAPQLETLVLHLIRSEEVISTAIDKLSEDHFKEGDEVAYKLLWILIQEYYEVYRKPPKRRVLEESVDLRINMDPDLEYIRKDLDNIIDIAYSLEDSALDPTYVIDNYLSEFLDERIVRDSLRSIDFDFQTSEEVIDLLNKAKSDATLSSAKKEEIFDFENDTDEDKRPPTPTGCVAFDSLLGGTRPAHMTGLLAPFMGGKTLLCTDACIKVAQNKDHSFMFHYEQPVRTNIRPRIWSNISRTPTAVIEKTKFEDYDDELKKKLRDNAYINDYLHVYDMQKDGRGGGGIKEIDSILQKHKAKGELPSFVAIDWLGIVVQNYIGVKNLNVEKDLRQIYQKMLHDVRYLIANKYNCEVVIAHQLSADAGKNSLQTRPSMYDAAEFRQFAALVDTCVIMCTSDPRNVARIFNAKNRGSIEDVWVRIRPEVCTVDLLEHQEVMTIRGADGRYYHSSRDADIGVD